LNQPKKPLVLPWLPSAGGLSIVAHSAGVKITAIDTESNIAAMIVTENCR
jgi:hypothetical protein